MCRCALGNTTNFQNNLAALPPQLCPQCWSDITFLTAASCITCALPFEISPAFKADHSISGNSSEFFQDKFQCAKCIQSPPPYTSTTSALLYDDNSKDLILRFKHGDATHLSPLFAHWMQKADQRLSAPKIPQADMIIPVPLHWMRLVKRNYNQASMLANDLSHLTGIKSYHTLLERPLATQPQGHFSLKERHKNVFGKFAIKSKKQEFIKEKVIILIDDVYTSGATISACTKELLKAGARDVHILTLARVARL